MFRMPAREGEREREREREREEEDEREHGFHIVLLNGVLGA
jgi:hypothetical protein